MEAAGVSEASGELGRAASWAERERWKGKSEQISGGRHS